MNHTVIQMTHKIWKIFTHQHSFPKNHYQQFRRGNWPNAWFHIQLDPRYEIDFDNDLLQKPKSRLQKTVNKNDLTGSDEKLAPVGTIFITMLRSPLNQNGLGEF